MPKATQLHEERIGSINREESVRGDALRVVWSMGDTVPLTPEPSMPPGIEVLANIKLSTIPDWDAWLSWERALLEGAFRSSPEVDALAKKLNESGGDTGEKVKRIHEYVMQDIRYQQDYETFIAGVKPHPAPMVLERKYGDCKDKAVLFITLAQKLGIDAHFALVRTRDQGPANPNVPMQQFNHAIVYVPEQTGFEKARFFDPTADSLDLDVLRSDDAGTKSLVYDPKKGVHTWRDIPFQSPEVNEEGWSVSLKLSKDGAGEGTYALKATGSTGSAMRRVARNSEVLNQGMQRAAASLIAGAATRDTKADEVKDLRIPALISTAFTTKSAARKEGDELRFKVPSDWSPKTHFGLAERKLPLVLGTPRTMTGQTRIELPEGFLPARLPSPAKFALPCMEFERVAREENGAVIVSQRIRYLCERITAAEYPQYREAAEAAGRALEEDLVMAPAPIAGKKAAKATLERKK
jgi:transglutaminase-like putative cysteine protease